MAGITEEGGRAYADAVDVTDAHAVERHIAAVVERECGVDVLFNALTHLDVQGTPLLEMDTSVMAEAVLSAVHAQTTTIPAAAKRMVERGSGVILTNVGHGPPLQGVGTTVVTWQLIEAMHRQWAVELGPQGVRVAWTRIGGTMRRHSLCPRLWQQPRRRHRGSRSARRT